MRWRGLHSIVDRHWSSCHDFNHEAVIINACDRFVSKSQQCANARKVRTGCNNLIMIASASTKGSDQGIYFAKPDPILSLTDRIYLA
ncbi:MAG TPA: hypothetical protein V6D10_16820 [Trichocoleus sp.]|jgi:hypothetical protein